MNHNTKSFLKLLFKLSTPIVLQQLLQQGMYLLDSLMIGSLGQNEIIAVANAGQISFLFNVFIFGACSAATIFTAQFFGSKDSEGISKTAGITVMSSGIIMLPFFFVSMFVPEFALSIINPDPNIVSVGKDYLRILSVSFVFTAIYLSFINVLRGMRKVNISFYISIFTVVLNFFINYALIFGNFGMPRLGVQGAAIGTTIALGFEALCISLYFFSSKNPAKIKLHNLFHFNKRFVTGYYKTASPIILNEILWAIGNFSIIVLYNRLGLGMAGAMAVFVVIERMCYVFYQGVANSAAIMVGNKIGEGRPDLAYSYGGRCLTIGPLLAVVLGFTVIGLSSLIVSLYSLSAESVAMLQFMFYGLPATMAICVFNYINLVGVLRGGGDTKFCTFSDLGCMYLIGIPVAYMLGLVFHIYPPIVYFAYIFSQDLTKMIIGLIRYRTKRWINDLTKTVGDIIKTQI